MNNKSIIISCIIFFGVVASILFFLINQKMGITYDSVIYLDAAESIKNGNGFYILGYPIAYPPPIYSSLLALFGYFNNNMVNTARLLHSLLFGLNIMLIGLAIHNCTKKSITAPILAVLLFFSSPQLFIVQSFVWSESLFLTLSLCGYILFTQHIVNPKLFTFFASSLCLGLAIITRYVGIALIFPVIITFLFFGGTSWKHKILKGSLFCFIVCIPVGLWYLRNQCLGISAPVFGMQRLTGSDIKSLIYTIHVFLFPFLTNFKYSYRYKSLTILCLFILLFIGTIIIYNRMRKNKELNTPITVLLSLCTIFSVYYVFFICLIKLFYDDKIFPDRRILFPELVFLLIATILFFWYISNLFKKSRIWYVFLIFALLAVVYNSKLLTSTIVNSNKHGKGFATDSETIMAIKKLDKNILVFSNADSCIRYVTGRQAVFLPNRNDKIHLNEMYNLCSKGKAVIVYLAGDYGMEHYYNIPSLEEIESTNKFNVIIYHDGIILVPVILQK